jgi:hypothetical protein
MKPPSASPLATSATAVIGPGGVGFKLTATTSGGWVVDGPAQASLTPAASGEKNQYVSPGNWRVSAGGRRVVMVRCRSRRRGW